MPSTTIFTEMTALAERTGALNLGQGFPDEDGNPATVPDAGWAPLVSAPYPDHPSGHLSYGHGS